MKNILIGVSLLAHFTAFSQTSDICKLEFGTNLSGVYDYMTEMPFIDLMHNAREWYTKDVDNENAAFNSEHASELTYRSDGYPTHVPQSIEGSSFKQKVATVWGSTNGWPIGTYTIKFEGNGSLTVTGAVSNVKIINNHQMTFDFNRPEDGVIELIINSSSESDPVHHIQVLMPGMENSTDLFNPVWLEKLSLFKTIRFMDWGATNHWSQPVPWEWEDPNLVDWDKRASYDHYTWSTNKGVPYEVMIQLMNEHDLDGWVCVPHKASDDYIRNMARLFRDHLEPDRKLHVEYSNELWNWMFGQAQWLNHYGCEQKEITWPEGLVPYIQNTMDIWTEEYGDKVNRIVRVVAVQTGWQDVSNRIVFNMTEGSFDAFAPAYYFAFSEEGDAALDELGATATVEDIAFFARQNFAQSIEWIATQKSTIADELDIPMVFYEGGQHLTPIPFGQEPTYAQALEDIQRDHEMYLLYQEWFELLKAVNDSEEPFLLMNFALAGAVSAQYGSWGIFETIDQNTDLVPAPKYEAIVDACLDVVENPLALYNRSSLDIAVFPNPSSGAFVVNSNSTNSIQVKVLNTSGLTMKQINANQYPLTIDLSDLSDGVYFMQILNNDMKVVKRIVKMN